MGDITDFRPAERRARKARVAAEAKGAVAFLRATDRLKAEKEENDRQRKAHVDQIRHAIKCSIVSPAMGEAATQEAVAAIMEGLGFPRRVSIDSPTMRQLRDSLDLLNGIASVSEVRRLEAQRQRAIITKAIGDLRDNSSPQEAIDFLADTLAAIGGSA